MATRRGKWHPPPAPTPRILHLPRRQRRSPTVVAIPTLIPGAPPSFRPSCLPVTSRNLAALLDQERLARAATAAAACASTTTTTTTAVSPATAGTATTAEAAAASSWLSAHSGEERWRFQAEILRAECNFLRMDREVALKKLDRNRAKMTTVLRSAMDTLVSGRKKVDGRDSVAAALDAEIASLEEKLEELKLISRSGTARTRSRTRSWSTNSASVREPQRNNARGNFDRQASVLGRRLEKMDDNVSVKDIREIAATPAPAKDDATETDEHRHEEKMEEDENDQWSRCRRLPNMEMLKRRMEGLSKGMLERMEECGSLLLSTKNTNNSSSRWSSGCSSQRVVGLGRYAEGDADKAINHNHYMQQQLQQEKQVEGKMGFLNCCNCKEVLGRIMQQVKAETEQWSEMQRMLDQVKLEMDELRSSRDHWQRRAVSSEINFRSLHAQMMEWKRKARSSEQSMNELHSLVSTLQNELVAERAELSSGLQTYVNPFHSELLSADRPSTRSMHRRPLLDLHKENEKHVLVCHLKPQNAAARRRLPLLDIRNVTDVEFGTLRSYN